LIPVARSLHLFLRVIAAEERIAPAIPNVDAAFASSQVEQGLSPIGSGRLEDEALASPTAASALGGREILARSQLAVGGRPPDDVHHSSSVGHAHGEGGGIPGGYVHREAEVVVQFVELEAVVVDVPQPTTTFVCRKREFIQRMEKGETDL